MKKKIFAGTLSLLALLAGSACSSENPVDEERGVLQLGDPTYAAFSVYFNNGQTRAGDDDNADAVEQKVSDITFFIFSGGVLEKHQPITVTSLSDPIPVAVTTGKKTVYAVTTSILDKNEKIKDGITKRTDFEKILISAICYGTSTDDSDTADSDTEGIVNIAAMNNFVMIGKETEVIIEKCTDQEAAIEENLVKIGIDRAAAKVQVIYPNGVKVEPLVNASFSDPYYEVAQSIKQMCVYTDMSDSDKDKNVYSPIGEKNPPSGTYTGFNEVDGNKMKFIKAPSASDAAFASNKYTGEVAIENPVSGNSTFAVVKLTCTPTNVDGKKALTDGTFYVLAHKYENTATWSFVTDSNKKIVYFASAADATAYKTTNDYTNYEVVEYTNGAVYYRIDLVHDKDVDGETQHHKILRNNYYRAKVKEIDGLGSPSPEGLVPGDPDTPIQKDSYLSAEITVKPWYAHDWDVNLE